MKLILVTSELSLMNEIPLIREALDKGFFRIHVKRAMMPGTELVAMLSMFTKEEHQQFVVHSNYEVAEEFELAGIHLPEWRRLKYPNVGQVSMAPVVSTSFHHVSEFEASVSQYEYGFIGPVYDSISKPGYKSNVDLRSINPLLKKKCVAIGGITVDNLSDVFNSGVSMAAVRGFVWDAKNPSDAIKKLADKVQMLKRIENE